MKTIIIPEGVEFDYWHKETIRLKGRYFFAGETADAIIFQSDPAPKEGKDYSGVAFIMGLVIGVILCAILK